MTKEMISDLSRNRSMQDVTDSIPEPIRWCVSQMTTPDEKSICLYAASAMTGALMPKVRVNYANQISYPALMLQIIFPPASGKGKLNQLSSLLNQIKNEQMSINNDLMAKYQADMRVYEKLRRKGEAGEPPERPKMKVLHISGNTTSSMLMAQLADNGDGMMTLVFETETDALSNMMGSKFGLDNSMMLRKAFHHETISHMRRLNSEHLEVTSPKVVVILSGTPNQMHKLFRNTEDGLFSRFLFVRGNSPVEWKNVQPQEGQIPLDDLFKSKSIEFKKLYDFFASLEVEVTFTDSQWAVMNSFGSERQNESIQEGSPDMVSLARRHTNFIVRIAAIHTMLRYQEDGRKESQVCCSDVDFLNACWMVDQSYENSVQLYSELSKKSEPNSDRHLDFLEKLPNSFKKSELAPLRDELQISDKTIERALKELCRQGFLVSMKRGFYEKKNVSGMSVDGKSHHWPSGNQE
jgi:hypothetical protein